MARNAGTSTDTSRGHRLGRQCHHVFVKNPAVVDRMEGLGVESTTTTPEQRLANIRAELPIYTDAIKAAGLSK